MSATSPIDRTSDDYDDPSRSEDIDDNGREKGSKGKPAAKGITDFLFSFSSNLIFLLQGKISLMSHANFSKSARARPVLLVRSLTPLLRPDRRMSAPGL